MQWVTQNNLGRHYVDQIEEACKKHGYKHFPIKVVPFSADLPTDIPNDEPTLFYGATRWIEYVYWSNQWSPGVFFDPENSMYTAWSCKYGSHCLNDEFFVTNIKELSMISKIFGSNSNLFIRPVADDKAFAGQVIKSNEVVSWADSILKEGLNFDQIPIIVSSPVGIAKEWRLFIVDGKVSTGSQYRTYHKLNTNPHVPEKVIEFAEERAKEFAPSPVFVIDVAETGGELYVIEVGCFNSAGFYASDVNKLIKDVSEFAMR